MTRQEVRQDMINLLQNLGLLVITEDKEKEPAPQEADTSSQTNISIKNDNTSNEHCQENIDYCSKYNEIQALIADISTHHHKLEEILGNIYNEYCIYDIGGEQFAGAACMQKTAETEEEKAAQNLLINYKSLFTLIDIAFDYSYNIRKLLETSKENAI